MNSCLSVITSNLVLILFSNYKHITYNKILTYFNKSYISSNFCTKIFTRYRGHYSGKGKRHPRPIFDWRNNLKSLKKNVINKHPSVLFTRDKNNFLLSSNNKNMLNILFFIPSLCHKLLFQNLIKKTYQINKTLFLVFELINQWGYCLGIQNHFFFFIEIFKSYHTKLCPQFYLHSFTTKYFALRRILLSTRWFPVPTVLKTSI